MLCPTTPLTPRFASSITAAAGNAPVVETSESQLIAASQRGDSEAYGTLVRKYQDRLCSSLRHVCRSSADAQDAAQEAFLRGYLKLGTYTGASAFYTWLYRIAVNVAMSEHRRRQARARTESSRSLRKEAVADATQSADRQLIRQERSAEVQEALACLSDEQRTILILREMEDFDYVQIASILSIPVGTVRSRLHRARLALREQLTPPSQQLESSRS
jgi:RNA polymerase sigma-70 factor (ECF subfamily)